MHNLLANYSLMAINWRPLYGVLLCVSAIFIILLVLVQRGRGGGLAGALGGVGGSSAFGAKAGDVFTRVTIVAATVWILLCIAAAKQEGGNQSRIDVGGSAPTSESSTSSGTVDDKTAADAKASADDAE